jgi:hypothetical protein
MEEACESKRNTQIEMWEKEEGFLFVLCHPVPHLLKLKERRKSYNSDQAVSDEVVLRRKRHQEMFVYMGVL